MEPITIRTFTEFQFVSSPSFSPDGSRIAFVVQQADLKDNSYHGDLYLFDASGGRISRLTSSRDVKSYVWTRQGTLLFPSERDGRKEEPSTAYYEIAPDGGEAVLRFELPLKVKCIETVDEDRYLILASVKTANKGQPESPAYEVIDEVPFWSNGKGFTDGVRNRLYLYRVSSGELLPVSEETFDCTAYSVRDGKILYKAYPFTQIRNRYDGIYLYDIESGMTRCLLPADTMRTGMISLWGGEEALFAATEDTSYGNGKYMDFYTLDLATGARKFLAPYDYSSGSGSVGSDARLGGGRTVKAGDGICYFVTTRGAASHLYAVRRDGSLEGVVTEDGSCDSFDVQDGHVAVCGLYGGKLAELYLDGRQVTKMNETERWMVSAPKEYSFCASDGCKLTGWVLCPVGYEPGRKYPGILNIHGGPRTVFGPVFHHEMQVWANAGYFVFYTNPRGSDGFGTEFGDIRGKYGTVDYNDLMEFTDYVLSQEPDLDPDRLGVAGGSYGGFMTNWIIGHTDRFRAAVSQRSIANWISFEYMSDIGHTFTKDNHGVFACEDVEKLWLHSPIKYVAGCKTPTLFIHSQEDYRCNVAEGMQMFAALKVLGVETRMCMLKGENHELSRSGRPRNRIVRMEEILNWMDGHLKGEAEEKEEAADGNN